MIRLNDRTSSNETGAGYSWSSDLNFPSPEKRPPVPIKFLQARDNRDGSPNYAITEDICDLEDETERKMKKLKKLWRKLSGNSE